MVDYRGVTLLVKTVKHQLKLAMVSQSQVCMSSSYVGLLCAAGKTWWSDSAAQDIFQPFKMIRSEVWAYFGFYESAEGKLTEDGYPVCGVCKKKVAPNGGNT